MLGLHIIWFRRDLRVHDHAALKAAHLAAARDGGQVLPLYVGDGPALGPLRGAVRDLDEALAQRGAALHFRTGHVLDALNAIHTAHGILSLHAHHDPDDKDTERAVEAWSLRAGLPFRRHFEAGELPGREAWLRYMSAPRHEVPTEIEAANIGIGHKLYLTGPEAPESAEGGRQVAIKNLRAVLGQVSNLSEIAAPDQLTGDQVFQLLQPHLALGVLSVREVWQAAMRAQHQYLSAGQDIRAARMSRLVERLQEMDLRTERSRPSPMRPRTGQYALDLFGSDARPD